MAVVKALVLIVAITPSIVACFLFLRILRPKTAVRGDSFLFSRRAPFPTATNSRRFRYGDMFAGVNEGRPYSAKKARNATRRFASHPFNQIIKSVNAASDEWYDDVKE